MPTQADIAKSVLTPATLAVTATKGTRKPWVPAKHLRFIDQAIVETVTGRGPPILIVETPPRHGKSELISRWLPVWYLGVFPEKQVILTSATDDLAAHWGYNARSEFDRVGHLFGERPATDRAGAKDWRMQAGGGMKTAGVGGDVMGRDGNLLILDDYLKSPELAFSETIRNKQWEWMQAVFLARLEPGGCCIFVATRWHEEDIIGRLVAESAGGGGLPIRRIHLPAIAEADDPIGRKPGEALWPERWPLGTEDEMSTNGWGETVMPLAMRKKVMVPYLFNALYQQRPSGHGRSMFPPDYFQDCMVPVDEMPDAYEARAMACDPSMGKDNKKGDYSAIVDVGLSGGKIWVTADLDRREPNKITNEFIDIYTDIEPDVAGIETNAAQEVFLELCDLICKERNLAPLALQGINNHSKKEVRISKRGRWFARNQIRIADTPGGRLLLRQLREFPGGDHDDVMAPHARQ